MRQAPGERRDPGMKGQACLMAPDRPIDVAFLTDDLGGGTGNHLLSMIRHWDKEAWRARIVSKKPANDRVAPDVPVELLPAPKRLKRYPVTQVAALAGLFTAFDGRPPDMVHAYFFWPVIYGRLLKLFGRIERLVENREDMGFNWGRHEYALLRLTSSLPDRVVCVCDAVRRVVLEREGLDEERVVVIRNGIDPAAEAAGRDEAVRAELGLREDDLVVGMVANYNRPVKGVGYLLEAIPRIVASVPQARFLLVGGGDQRALREKARAMNAEPYVVLAGYRKDVERLYGAMDISVLTSLSEGLSLTVLESMAHGLPVVATDVGGNPEAIEEGLTGFLVTPRDVFSFADRIVRLLLDGNLRVRMGQEGRRRIERRFRMGDVANRYLDVYRDVIRRSARPLLHGKTGAV
jgi:glycosyltransferase involved in cell wall biosynthesis